MRLFWIHGGPGYNARPETLRLDPKLKSNGFDTFYWAHPSLLRGSSDVPQWDQYMKDLEEKFLSYTENEPCFIVAHSFGARCSTNLLEKYSDRIMGVIWVAGASSMLETFKNIFKVVAEDYAEKGYIEKATGLRNVASNPKVTLIDFLTHIAPVVENENFLQFYWSNKKAMNDYYPLFVDEWALDMDCFGQVIATLPELASSLKTEVPALMIYGEDEVIVNNHYELEEAKKIFTDVKVTYAKDCSHFLHMEDEEFFLQQLVSFTNAIQDQRESLSLS